MRLDQREFSKQLRRDQTDAEQKMRFWDNQILKEMGSVMESILKTLTAGPLTPALSRVGERGTRDTDGD